MIRKIEKIKVQYDSGTLPIYQIVPIKKLHTPDWYFKKPLTSIAKNKLKKLIKLFGPGVISCRHWSLDHLEIIDGNQRVEICKELGMTEIGCINHGKLSRERTIILARSLNHQWSQFDNLLYANQLLGQGENIKWIEIPFNKITELTPESPSQVEDLLTRDSFMKI